MIENEKILIGTLLTDSHKIQDLDYLKSEFFISENNRKIFDCIREFDGNVDIQVLLEKTGINAKYFAELQTCYGEIHYHAKRIIEDYIKRVIRGLSIIEYEDAFELLSIAESTITSLGRHLFTNKIKNVKELINDFKVYIENVLKGEREILFRTGYYDLDNLIGGLMAGNLYILAARPSQGKTSFALCIASNIAEHNKVGFFSIEMSSLQLIARYIAIRRDLNVQKLLEVNLSNQEILEIERMYYIENDNLIVDDTAGISLLELKSKAKKMVRDGVKLIVVDYLQLITTELKETREQEVTYISKNLKALAKELNIPILVLAQLNRQVELRSTKEPELADLRESGSIEQDADVVIFLWRPEIYGIEMEEGRNLKGIAKLKVGKNRNGMTGRFELMFEKETTKFKNLTKLDEII